VTRWVTVGVALALVAACRSVALDPVPQPAPAQCRDLFLDSLADYALALRQHDDAALLAERDRLEAAPPSSDRDLRLALLLSQHPSSAYDPERASKLLQTLSADSASDSVHKSVAETLFSAVASGPGSCADSTQVRELATQLSVEQQRRQEATARLENARQELESERTQRARLEQQLDALKSLEEQIKNRDSDAGR
jgi:hypothetical protein